MSISQYVYNNIKLPVHKQRKETEGLIVKSQIPHEIGQYNSDIISFWIPGTIITSQKWYVSDWYLRRQMHFHE